MSSAIHGLSRMPDSSNLAEFGMNIICASVMIQVCISSCQEAMLQEEVVQAIKGADFRRFSVACVQLTDIDFIAGYKFDDYYFKGEDGSRGSMDRKNWTSLMVLCGGNRICEGNELCREHMVSLLLGLGADPNYSDRAGPSCLGDSILRKRPVIARMLLRAGARPRESGDLMDHTMMYAVQCQPDLVADLVLHGANVNVRQNGDSYGDWAIRTQSYGGLQQLVASGFDLTLLDASEFTGFSSPVRAPKDPADLAEWRRTVRWIRRRLSASDH